MDKSAISSMLKELTQDELRGIVNRLVYLRSEKLGMTQMEFSNLTKISQANLSLIETGKREITTFVISSVINSIPVNPEWLIYGNGGEAAIFADSTLTEGQIRDAMLEEAFESLKSTYGLTNADISFLKEFCSFDSCQRKDFLNAVAVLKSLP